MALNLDAGGSSAAGVRLESASELGHRGAMPRALGRLLQGSADADVDLVAAEEHALWRQPGQVEAEAAVRAACGRKLQGPVQLTSILLVGLRRIRYEYLQRARAAAELMQIRLSLSRPAAPDEPDQQVPPEVLPAVSVFTRWMDGEGARVLQEMRWQLLPPSAIVARTRTTCPRHLPREQTLIRLLQGRGVPVLTGGIPVWTNDLPTWSDTLAVLTLGPCNCQPADNLTICWDCGRLRPLIAREAQPSPCIWCRRSEPCHSICDGCRTVLHYRGTCPAWNRGANPIYDVTAISALQFCPDCIWRLLTELADCPRAPPAAPPADLELHLSTAAAACSPGAGHTSAVPAARTDMRRVRRWVLRRLRAQEAVALGTLASEWCDYQSDPGGPFMMRDSADELNGRAVSFLMREGKVDVTRGRVVLR